MKAKPEHIEIIRSLLSKVENKPVWEDYKARGLSPMRWRWDYYYLAKIPWDIQNEFYTYLHDDHIDTVLKYLLKSTKV